MKSSKRSVVLLYRNDDTVVIRPRGVEFMVVEVTQDSHITRIMSSPDVTMAMAEYRRNGYKEEK